MGPLKENEFASVHGDIVVEHLGLEWNFIILQMINVEGHQDVVRLDWVAQSVISFLESLWHLAGNLLRLRLKNKPVGVEVYQIEFHSSVTFKWMVVNRLQAEMATYFQFFNTIFLNPLKPAVTHIIRRAVQLHSSVLALVARQVEPIFEVVLLMIAHILFKVFRTDEGPFHLSMLLIEDSCKFDPTGLRVLITDVHFDVKLLADWDFKLFSGVTFLKTPEPNDFRAILINRAVVELCLLDFFVDFDKLDLVGSINKTTQNTEMSFQILACSGDWAVHLNLESVKGHEVLCTLMLIVSLPLHRLFTDLAS